MDMYFYLSDENTFKRLGFIKRCRALDISLSEIEALLELEQQSSQNCHAMNQLIEQYIKQVTDKIIELQKSQQHIIPLRASCSTPETIDSYQILKQLEAENK
nr:MerR family DNA-binding protein [Acinetobacter sp. ANC 5378]